MLTCIECCLNTVISTTLNYSIGCDISLTMWHIQPKEMNDTFEPKKVVTVFGFYKLHFKQLYYKSTTDVLTCSDFVVSVFTNIHFLKNDFHCSSFICRQIYCSTLLVNGNWDHSNTQFNHTVLALWMFTCLRSSSMKGTLLYFEEW